jgi:Putative metal-binding motif
MAATARCIAIAILALALAPAAALADATVELNQDLDILTIVDLSGDADDIAVAETTANHIVTGTTLVALGDCAGGGTTVTCPRAVSVAVDLGLGDDRFDGAGVSIPVSIAGGGGLDELTTGSGGDVLAGGEDRDALTGGAGVDDYFGEGGNDEIKARDGTPERIACGAGDDRADNDFVDIIAECERGVDGDGDAFASSVDCNDAAPAIFPGATEVLDNGVDENCDGRDNPNLDRDGDGFPVPVDCNDGSAAIRPGALETRGNAVDENCDRRAEPFAELAAVVSARWLVAGRHARLRTLIVRLAPRGARIVLRCRGRSCPVRTQRRTVPRDLAPIRLHRRFRRARLRPGTRLTLTISAPGAIERTYTYRIKRGEVPVSRIECRAPGESRGRAC